MKWWQAYPHGEGSGLDDRRFQPRNLAAASALLPARRRLRAGPAHRRPAGLRPAGVADPATADGSVRRPAVPGHRPAAVGASDPPDPGPHRGRVRRPSPLPRRTAGSRSRQAPRGRALLAESQHTPRPRRAAIRRPAEPGRPEPPARRRAHRRTHRNFGDWSLDRAGRHAHRPRPRRRRPARRPGSPQGRPGHLPARPSPHPARSPRHRRELAAVPQPCDQLPVLRRLRAGRGTTGEPVIEELARERLGFERLRPGQLRAVEALAGGRDVLAVLPTGGGKSAIYELAGLLRTGPTVVVSPLIALQADQLAHLRAAGLPAIVLNSHLSAGARAAALLAAFDSATFVLSPPQQLANSQTRETLPRARPGLFAVDEAHLISQWGRDFRPDYMLLGAQGEAIGAPVRVALTATAAPPVRQEIIRRLGLRDPVVVMGDFDRPHIHLSARHVRTIPDKERELVAAAGEFAGAGIVYAATHASAQAAHDALASAGGRGARRPAAPPGRA